MPKMPKHLRKRAKRAKSQGWKVEMTKGNHFVWIAPHGQKVYSAATPSDIRADKNHRARMRRAGFRE